MNEQHCSQVRIHIQKPGVVMATEARKKEKKDQRPPGGARLKTERKNAG